MRLKARQNQPLGNWTLSDEQGYLATIRTREDMEHIVEGLQLREVAWQSGLQMGCWHKFESAHESPVPFSMAWLCLECGGYLGWRLPIHQKAEARDAER